MGNRGDTCLRVCATVGGAVAATRRVGRFAQGTYVVKMAAIDTGPTVSLRFRRRPRGPGPSKDQSLDVRDRSRLDDQRRVFRQQESLFPPSCKGGATGESGEAGVLSRARDLLHRDPRGNCRRPRRPGGCCNLFASAADRSVHSTP